jgi:hypothetical protein
MTGNEAARREAGWRRRLCWNRSRERLADLANVPKWRVLTRRRLWRGYVRSRQTHLLNWLLQRRHLPIDDPYHLTLGKVRLLAREHGL